LIRSQAVILEFKKFIVSNIKNDGTKVFANFLIKHSLYCSFDFTLLSLISFVPIRHLSPLIGIRVNLDYKKLDYDLFNIKGYDEMIPVHVF